MLEFKKPAEKPIIISAYGCGCSWAGEEQDHPVSCALHVKNHTDIIRLAPEQSEQVRKAGLGWDHSATAVSS